MSTSWNVLEFSVNESLQSIDGEYLPARCFGRHQSWCGDHCSSFSTGTLHHHGLGYIHITRRHQSLTSFLHGCEKKYPQLVTSKHSEPKSHAVSTKWAAMKDVNGIIGISMDFMFTIQVRFVSIFILVDLYTSCSCSELLPTLSPMCNPPSTFDAACK
jgi:hypothetical protein